MIYDLVIIGGGPAGVAAGVYAARKRLKTALITAEWGGQSIVSPDIQNWIGTINISGQALADQLKAHVESYQGEFVDIKTSTKVVKVEKSGEHFIVDTTAGDSLETKTVLVATGANRRKLNVPGAAKYDQKGLTYCATCDGPLFADQDVAVIGGGNAAMETAGQLLAYCKSVTILHHGPEFKGDQITLEKLLKNPKFHALLNAETTAIKGEKFVSSLTYLDKETNQSIELPVKGIFVEIGNVPATDFVKDLVELTPYGSIMIDHKTQRASRVGIWAAGDCTDALYHQNNIAAGDAIKALEDIYNYLHLS